MLDGGASLATGVGGVSDVLAVKCLHAHVAHALARPGYVLGEADPRRGRGSLVRRPPLRRLPAGRRPDGRPARTAGRTGVKVAIVDLGTNTCRLFLADVTGGARGAGRSGSRPSCGSARASTRPAGCTRTPWRGRTPASPGTRRASRPTARSAACSSPPASCATPGTAAQFLVALKYDFGLPWRILTGQEEGTLAFRGGTSWLAAAPTAPAGDGAAAGAARVPDPLLLVDIGGGSTEFAVGSAGEPPAFVRSLDVGVVRLTERFFHHDPPEAAEVAALTGHVAAAIADAVPAELRAAVRGAVGVAGTYTTLVANKLGMTEYDGRLVQGHVLTLAEIDARASPASPRSPARSAAGCRASSPAAKT